MTPRDLDVIVLQASCRASQLVSSARFRPHDWDDLRQELIFDLLRRSRRFDPARGDWHGFVRGVARNQAAELVVRQRRRAPELLADDLVTREETGDFETLDILDRRPPASSVEALDLSLDVRRVIESLPTPLQALAALLGEMPVQDACRRTGKSRSRVYQMTRQLRDEFIRAGFQRQRPRKAAVGR